MNRRGMTLIEIVVALMIVAVLFAAVTFGVGALTGASRLTSRSSNRLSALGNFAAQRLTVIIGRHDQSARAMPCCGEYTPWPSTVST